MNETETEKTENHTFRDGVVLGAAAAATVMAVGGLVRLGYDLAGEGIIVFKTRRAVKKSEKDSPK